MSKKTKILIGVLAVGAVIIAGWWTWKPPAEMGCDEKCKLLGYTLGYCGAEVSGKGACLEEEVDIGVTKDCEVKEKKILIAPRTCCCELTK